jgi:hypothetical protein
MRRLPWWFLIPLFTFGVGSAPIVIYGGVRLRRWVHVAAGIAYGALLLLFFVGASISDPDKVKAVDFFTFPALLISWLGGTVHAVILQYAVRDRDRDRQRRPVDPALAEAWDHLEKRAQARALLAANPALAAELLIGRPDLGRRYDDGGLVDINHVPVETLMTELGLPPKLANQVTAARDNIRGFSSADELIIYCDDMTPARLSTIRDRLAFLPW